jgi:D-sedoheptulose 7-phosphate isomerase
MKEKLEAIKKISAELVLNEDLLECIKNANQLLISAIKNEGKILVCGNGGSATQASHMVGELVGRFGFDRPALPAISLFDLASMTAIGNDYGYSDIFSRFVDGLGNRNDILFSISTSGNSENCLKAMESAQNKKMINIALLGKDGGAMKNLADIAIVVPCNETPLIQEIHLMVIHNLCEKVESYFFKQ